MPDVMAAVRSAIAAAAVLWVALIKIVLDPMGVPSAPIIFALMLFEPFFNGLLFLLNSLVSCAAVALVAGRKKDEADAARVPSGCRVPAQ
ncbi:MAG: hypothetical protein PHV34_11485 [Verrucomicrobiae bacterium]|nr:hypothetical protein [Verrucomicrobiae bacterium]